MGKPNLFSIVGARPNFVKLAALSPEIRKVAHETIIHTGQHYDYNLSKAFFDELDIPSPDYHLDVGSGPHGKQTGEMLSRIEKVLFENMMTTNNPDAVIVYGDTNTTLAGALAASKLHIPVIHIESGARSFDRRMPEETNRVIVDHISDVLFCSTPSGYDNLSREGITASKVYSRGDVMVDLMKWSGKPDSQTVRDIYEVGGYHLLTIHREENSTLENLQLIFRGLSKIDTPFVFPCHPRIKKFIPHLHLKENFHVIDPVGYFEMRELETYAGRIVTDSGGVQKEAYLLKKPCITLRTNTEWTETLQGGWNILAGTNPDVIAKAFKLDPMPSEYRPNIFGAPGVCKVIAKVISEEFQWTTSL